MNVIELELFNKLFAAIAEEMGIILTRAAFSANIKERRDFSCALFDGRGRLVAQASHIPVHLGSMPLTLQNVLARLDLGPDDIAVTNDPFLGGSHLPDITVVQPMFWQDRPLFYLVNRAHHADIGGAVPGSMGLATSIDQEGLRIPPTHAYLHGAPHNEFWRPFLAGVRNPAEREGDLKAQFAALHRGRQRLQELLQRYGTDKTEKAIHGLLQYSQRLMQQSIRQIPDGIYRQRDYLDDDGIDQGRPIPIEVAVTIQGEQATLDFRGSADQVAGPLNTVESVTISAAIYVFQCLVGEGYPINQGSYRPIAIRTRPGSIVAARPPAAVAAGNVETSQRLVDVLFGALAQAIPDRIPAASCGSMNNITIGGQWRGRQYTYYETIGGGMGGRPGCPGLSAIHTHMTNTMNTPVEALEHEFPLFILGYGRRHGSGGQGTAAGGDGITRSYGFLAPAQLSLLTERRRFAPPGSNGGKPGKRGRNTLTRKGQRKKIPGKTSLAVFPGDIVTIHTPGGGGWGPEKK